MKYTPEQYSEAFWQVASNASDSEIPKIVSNFVQAVAKYGDLSRRERIVEAIETKQVRNDGGRVIKLEFARKQDNTIIDELLKSFETKDQVTIVINSSLIAGVRVTIDGEKELDMSMQHKLNKLFN